MWTTLCKNVGVTDCPPHTFRHTWATWHYMANRDVAKLMELGGWKSLDMVMRYTHVNRDHLRASIDDIWGEAKSANRKIK
ncbi:tyrosine-type recombinase/integrase [Asticcacaulis sp. BYS171W]|uniref:Tyrosine-type recombinase/integrase n=1 Tax=Asticcacaulis aquaticus TaxID=2984212 RepID=A0ABT5HUZ5_9CAUL|nr:tyrosine-type recombinase/integrase [Asticcacaulis aquaticus]